MSSLDVRDVSKSFAGAPVLRGIDLSVEDGTTIALLGPSGSGKSTLLRIIAGLERADTGSVAIGGDDVTDAPTHRRDVGVVFQSQALFPHLDVAGNVAFGLRMAGVAAESRRRRVEEVLDALGLPGYERRDTTTLSGGEAQRVALARALASRPRVVLLDEPLAGLDQLLRERLLTELRTVFADLGSTVVAVTHDPTEAAVLGHRVAVLLDGYIEQEGRPGEVFARPVSSAVAGLVGQRNVVVGSVVGDEVRCGWGTFPARGSAGNAVAVLVAPDGVRVDDDGDLEGTVTSLVFRGGSAFAVVEGSTWPALDVRADPAWTPGTTVRLSIDPSAVHVMATEEHRAPQRGGS